MLGVRGGFKKRELQLPLKTFWRNQGGIEEVGRFQGEEEVKQYELMDVLALFLWYCKGAQTAVPRRSML